MSVSRRALPVLRIMTMESVSFEDAPAAQGKILTSSVAVQA
jgi:hypothetical protein